MLKTLYRQRIKCDLLLIALMAALLTGLPPVRLRAQSTALLTGTVVDPTGAVVPGAEVVCRNTQTGLTSTDTTNGEGLFRFPALPIGAYELVVTHSGFEKLTRSGLQLLTGQSADLYLQLTVGQTVQAVEVRAAAPVVQPTASVVQTTIESRNMRELPLNGRNPLQLVTLTPGTQLTGTGTEGNQQENQGVTTNGLRSVDNNYDLDGVTYENREFSNVPELPNPDALQEFTMKSSNFSAAYSGPGATMLLSTRSGTNNFHGSVFEFLRNNVLDSRNSFATSVSAFKRNQFGATFGGPIQKNKTFIFGSYQGTRLRGAASPSLVTVPTLAERGGDFSGQSKIMINPTTGKPFPGNMIPSGQFDTLSLKLLPLIPLPTPGLSIAGNRAELTPLNHTNDDQFVVRLDRNFSSKDHFSTRYFRDEYDYRRLTSPFPGLYALNNFLDQNLLISDTHTFSPSLLFVGSFGYTRTARTQIPKEPVTLQSLGQKVPEAISGAAPELRTNIIGYVNLFSGGGLLGRPGVFQYRGQFTWVHGKHLLQFGADVARDRMFAFDTSFASGTDTFNGSRTGVKCPKGQKCGDSFADFLLGLPNELSQGARTPQNFRETDWAPWMEDDWKVLPRLTLNLGLRWEPSLPPYDLLGPAAGFEAGVQSTVAPLAPVGLVFTGDAGLRNSIWPADWNNFAPRVGLAWDVQGNGKTVIRSAFGIFYNSTPLNMVRTSNSGSAFRSLSTDIINPPSFDDPYANFPGGAPFPFTPPPTSALKTYKFLLPVVTSLLDPHARTGYTEEWNFTAERQLRSDLGVSVSYVGNEQHKVMATRQINPKFPGTGVRVYPNFGPLALATPWEFGNYHALQVSVTKRTSRGLSLIANYVYSRCMDNESGETIGADAGGGSAFNNKFDINNGYGPCSWDLQHHLTVSLIYDLPRLSALHGPADKFLNGWETTSIITMSSGLPFTVTSGRDNSKTGPPNSDTADQVGTDTGRPAGVSQLQEWFNTAAFVANNTAGSPGPFGNVGRDSQRGPGSWNVDFGLLKTTPITERLGAEFRFEAFNFFNHPNPGGPNSNFNSQTFGQILSASDPRVLQFALKLIF